VAYHAVHALVLQFTRSATPPDVHLTSFLCRSFTRPSTVSMLAVIEGLGTRLCTINVPLTSLIPKPHGLGMRINWPVCLCFVMCTVSLRM